MRALIPVMGAIALLSLPTSGRAAGLSAAGDFNVLTFGNFQSTSDVEGKLAVGGDMTVSGFSVGSRLDASSNGSDTLVVGGTLNFGGGSIAYGNVAWGAAYNGPGYDITPNGSERQDSAAFNFAAARADLTGLSTALGGLTANGTTYLNPWGQVKLTGTDATQNVFSLNTGQLSTLNGFEIDVPLNSTTIINVTGNNATFGNFAFSGSGVNNRRTLFNFVAATSFNTSGIAIEGSVLAPLADATMSGGSVNGQFVANSATMLNGGEGHYYTFQGNLPPGGGAGAPVPEPGSMALLAMGLLPALPMLRRRKA